MSGALRVLHCPDVVGGHAPQLARAERALGQRSWSVAFQPNPYGYDVDETLARPGDRFFALERKRISLLLRALREFDVVHFNFGSSLFPGPSYHLLLPGNRRRLRSRVLRLYQSLLFMRDLPLLRRAGKAIFVTFQGDDARQSDYCRAHFPVHFVHEVGADYYPPGSDEQKRRAIERFAAFCHGIYALNPDLLHVLPATAKFVPYASVDLEGWRPVPATGNTRLQVVHAPSHRGVKGTRHLVEAVERLKRSGVAIDLVLVEGLTRGEARKAYERADVAVDQLLAGWYGGFAVEAMALGKPVVAYLRDADLGFIPEAMRAEMPVINAAPATIEAVLRSLAEGPRRALAEIGFRGRAYVEKWHDPARIASSILADYQAALAH